MFTALKVVKTKLSAVLVSMAMILAAALVSGVATPAAVADEGDGHTVDTVSPAGTTINMFDYWITEQDANDAAFTVNNQYPDAVSGTTGINTGHQLQFTPGGDSLINQWTGYVDGQSRPELGIRPRSGMVKNTLVNGYPELTRNAAIGISRDESLAYLFDSNQHSGKASYLGATGLLQIKDGYYEYNSAENFASFDTNDKSFKVYDKPAIYKNNTFNDAALGQFFPSIQQNKFSLRMPTDLKPRRLILRGVGRMATVDLSILRTTTLVLRCRLVLCSRKVV